MRVAFAIEPLVSVAVHRQRVMMGARGVLVLEVRELDFKGCSARKYGTALELMDVVRS